MLTHLYLVRHAASPYVPGQERERPLSHRGLLDAQRVATRLRDEGITAVYSSPYRRAIQTVQGVADTASLTVRLDERLRERELAGASHPIANHGAAVAQLFADPTFAFPGGESNQTAQIRGVACLRDILAQHPGQRVTVGTHGNILVITLAYFDPGFDFAFWQQLAMPDIYKVTFDGYRFVTSERFWDPET